MKEAISTETVADSSHSRIPEGNGYNNSGNSLKSAAMLGIALSVGASGALISQTEASAAVSIPTTSAATKAFSSNSEASVTSTEAAAHRVVGYHTVKPGESLWQIAQQYHVGLRELKSTNALPQETAIRVGQILKVPGSIPGSTVEAATPTSQLIAGITAAEATNASALNLRPDASQRSDSQLSSYRLNDELNDEAVVAGQAVAPTVSAVRAETVASNQPPSPAAVSIEIADASIKKSAATESAPVITAMVTPSTFQPSPFQQYRVQSGDTLSAIASSLDTTPQKLIQANALANPNVILAGDTLRVPVSSQPSASSNNTISRVASGAPRSESKLVADLRNATPQAPASVGGEQVTAKDLLGSDPTRVEGVDPYVANLLAEVQEIRSQKVKVSEVSAANGAVAEGDTAQDSVQNNVQSNVAEAGASRLLARSEQPAAPAAIPAQQSAPSSPSIVERVSLAPSAQPSATAVDSELLAAAPLSPDAYIPAQRSGQPQVVSPEMPILPGANEYLPETPSYFNGYIWPARGTITSGFGWRWGRMHRGVDVAGPVGTPVVAAGSGVIATAGWNSGGYGNMVEIQHPDGSMTRYAHNNRLNVSVGQAVKQGQQIAEMGSTGYSTGPHLHFEVHPHGGEAVNPVAYLPTSGPS